MLSHHICRLNGHMRPRPAVCTWGMKSESTRVKRALATQRQRLRGKALGEQHFGPQGRTRVTTRNQASGVEEQFCRRVNLGLRTQVCKLAIAARRFEHLSDRRKPLTIATAPDVRNVLNAHLATKRAHGRRKAGAIRPPGAIEQQRRKGDAYHRTPRHCHHLCVARRRQPRALRIVVRCLQCCTHRLHPPGAPNATKIIACFSHQGQLKNLKRPVTNAKSDSILRSRKQSVTTLKE